MRLVIALGGNALLKRGENPTAANQRSNMQSAAAALARACAGKEVAIVHGNGPQVGLLALIAAAYTAVAPYPLDVLNAESQGMIGYVIAQELRNAVAPRGVVCLLTQTLIDASDPAFERPTKLIGPVYASLEEGRRSSPPDWIFAADGKGYRRVVPSPRPAGIVEFDEIDRLVRQGVVTICGGGGGIPVISRQGRLEGVEAVIDKDFTAALLAIELDADRLIILTDVGAVQADWGQPTQRPIATISASGFSADDLAEGSMRPKVEAAVRFVEATGRSAVIGALSDVAAVVGGHAGTTICR
ncbi:carbamate kinase [Sphingopyxis terrae]|uniref:Carbamate kinase n=1 Tax=Sphingopyxis terrae subsp. ummariensis TaxID=429001 RepID=A0A1Y6G268_9SPHN|nr:carbamate kinase [Sphingopyxis terrae]PCF90041.1 carbamate kinase [Sphingopyxis terrae subsp. ummariensis]SMQ79561.1 carbamate kinase [Sphingopyxis terrae subsp. ummariensis]